MTLRHVVVAATIGNVLEWFDFVIYGFLAVTIAQVFFPTGDPTVSLLVTFGAFGLAYLVRPLGAIFIGSYTDKHGRKAGLTLSIALMMLGTALMALTPGYASIGIAAPILITLARLFQGFSVGGEFGSSVAKKLMPLTVVLSTSRGLVRRPMARTPAEKSSSVDR
jgi:MFS transporter, MHS family, proline/betaine transporter